MPRLHPLVRKLRSAALELGLSRGRLLLAVSGGPDSVALLLGLAQLRESLGLQLEVATIDHRLRPGSERDALYVERLSRALGLPCWRREVQVGAEGGLEAAARRARYRALREIAAERDCRLIATGHTLEDQAETLLLRLARGAGTRGQRAILARRGAIVRPMLEISREEVASYLRERRVRARQDPTNRSLAIARNRVRALALPALVEALGPGALRAIARSAQVAAADERLLARHARRHAERILEPGPEDRIGGPVAPLLRLPEALRLRVLGLAGRRAGLRLTAGHLRRMAAALRSSGPARVALPHGAELLVRYGRFEIGASAIPEAGWEHELLLGGLGRVEGGGLVVEVREEAGPGRPPEGCVRLDPERLALPLTLRSRRPGDRFRPRGGHEKKLKAFLIDRKLPRERRERLRLLVDATGKVLWIVGLGESQEAEHGERAVRAWEVEIRGSGSSGISQPLSMVEGPCASRAKGPSQQAKKRPGTRCPKAKIS